VKITHSPGRRAKIPTVALRGKEPAFAGVIKKDIANTAHSWNLKPKDYVMGHAADTPHVLSPAGAPQIVSPQTATSNAAQSVQERAMGQGVESRNTQLQAEGKEGPLEFKRNYRQDLSAEKNMAHDAKLPDEVRQNAENYDAAAAEKVKANYLARNDAAMKAKQVGPAVDPETGGVIPESPVNKAAPGPPVDPKTGKVIDPELPARSGVPKPGSVIDVESPVRSGPSGDPVQTGIIVAEVLHDIAKSEHITREYQTWPETLAKGPLFSIIRVGYEAIEGANGVAELIRNIASETLEHGGENMRSFYFGR
jgi:hypothetical protein